MKRIKKGAKIAKYKGTVKSQAEYDKKPSGYGVSVAGGRVIDAASTQSSIARYANNCRGADKKAKECRGNNAKFSINNRTTPPTVWIKATKNIAAGTEILLAYGSGYWR